MEKKSGFPYLEVQFTKTGEVHDRSEVTRLKEHLGASDATDLLVLAHGWNNDMAEARRLYDGMLRELRSGLNAQRLPGAPKEITVLGVLWPSKKFADKELIASGAARLTGLVTQDTLFRQIEQLEEVLDEPGQTAALESMKTLVPRLEDSPKAQREFADLLRTAIATEAAGTDAPPAEEGDDASDTFFELPGDELMRRLAKPVEPDEPATTAAGDPFDDVGGAARLGTDDMGGAAGLGDLLSGITSAASNLLNYGTFFSMKQRAGLVGQRGVNGLLRDIAKLHPGLRIHLAGHSFGARLVTAATAGADERSPFRPTSLVLLQAAFSHNGFAENFDGRGRDGAFRRLVTGGLVQGPTVVTHTRNDRAVGLAYPLASLISGSDAAGLGDENDRFGGMGRNGAQFTPEAERGTLASAGSAYRFERGRVYNLRADAVISHHSDIVSPEVAHVMIAAMTG